MAVRLNEPRKEIDVLSLNAAEAPGPICTASHISFCASVRGEVSPFAVGEIAPVMFFVALLIFTLWRKE